MRRRWLVLGLLLAACGGSPRPAEVPAETVATWAGGGAGLAELDRGVATAQTPACRESRGLPGGGSLEQLIPCYREVAESLALEDLVLAELGEGVERAITALDDYEELRGQAYLAAHIDRLRAEIEISDGEIEGHFEAHRDRYRRPGSLRLWNIFRRHADPDRPEETVALLREVRRRFAAGETFEALARELSQSETRARGGLVGTLERGVLPASLERVAFGLASGEVSEPVRVKGGAVLLYVRNVVEEAEPPLSQVAPRIRGELAADEMRRRLAAAASGLEPPPEATVLTTPELLRALDGDEPERPVLRIIGAPLTVAQLRQMAGLGPSAAAADLAAPEIERLEESYRAARDRQLLMLHLPQAAGPELRAEAEAELGRRGVSRLVDERLRREMESLVDAEPERLRLYWQDNRHQYQTPLSFEVRIWRLPFGDAPPRQLLRMERLRERLAAGALDLEAAAAELGGRVEELGWREYEALAAELSPAALAQLLELGGSGFTPPFHQGGELRLIRLERRREPRPLAWEEARERVRRDYLERFQRQLYRRALEARLDAAGFVFDEEAIRRLLAPPAPEPAAPAGREP